MNFSIVSIVALLISIWLISSSTISFAQNSRSQNMASQILNHQTLILPKSVRNFVILIPNEAHESPLLPKEQRLINQPYVPQHLFAPPNINIAWFSGDVGHTRKVTLADQNSETIFESSIKFNSISPTIAFNNSGTFSYYEHDANSEDPNFVLNGTITINDPQTQSNNNTILQYTHKIMSTLMVPTKDIKEYTELLDDNKVDILGQESFIDLRETGSGGANQTLLVLGSNGQIDDTISVFKKITPSLPYS
ncbi:MAG TPA: hypothetical protein VJS91_11280 [Nitrososphaeraceae archaeon]|nr:hypothetical protein [Nitrososphaeraceae archaeon]